MNIKDLGILGIFGKKDLGILWIWIYIILKIKEIQIIIFKRKIYDEILQWKTTQKGKTALLIKGPHRVGKTTVVKEFATKEYRSYIFIDFAKTSTEIKGLFNDLSNLNDFFSRLQVFTHTRLYPRESVIVFDEIQLYPKARQAIKFLVEDSRYDYIETGSLLSIKKNTVNILIPSEETRLTMTPLDFEEFKWALGDMDTCTMLFDFYKELKPLTEPVNRKMMRDLRLYMLIGGMPQSIVTYLETNNFELVDQTKREILELYEDDFRKIDHTGTISRLFAGIPSELRKEASKYQIASILPGKTIDNVEKKLQDLEDSLTVNFAYHANDPNIGFALHRDNRRFKLYLADTGLFITLAFKDKKFIDNIIYEQLLSDKLDTNLGFIYENLIAQMLRAKGEELYYYTFAQQESNHLYEIDFLLSRKNKICPIEVKSSSYKRHASLDAFSSKFSRRISKKYLLYTKDISREKDIIMLPVYMTLFL